MKNYSKHFGFSLAEVLVTMGVLGALAVLTLPTLKTNYEAHVIEAKVKTNYNLIQQAIANSPNAGSTYKNPTPENWFKRYMKNNIKIAKDCGSTNKCWHDIKSLSGSVDYGTNRDNVYSFKLENGTSIIIVKEGSLGNRYGIYLGDDTGEIEDAQANADMEETEDQNKETSISLWFDINGDEPPNMVGYDVYILGWKNKEMLPAGYGLKSSTLKNSCKTKSNGRLCMQYIIENGWKVNREIFE